MPSLLQIKKRYVAFRRKVLNGYESIQYLNRATRGEKGRFFMKYFKRISAFLLAGVMSVTGSQMIFAAENDDTEYLNLEEYTNGLMELNTICLGEEEDTDTSLKLYGASSYSYTEFYDWGNTAGYYYYNQLSDDDKAVWDEMYEVCNYYLNTSQTYDTQTSDGITYGILDEIDISAYGMTYNEVNSLFLLFKFSNPQFFFLEPGYAYVTSSVNVQSDTLTGPGGSGMNGPGMSGPGMTGPGGSLGGGGVTTISGIYMLAYSGFASGSTRYSCAKEFADKIDSWASSASSQSSELLKEKKVHDLLCNNTTYDEYFDGLSSSKQDQYEQTHYTQSAYSAMLGEETVCAGYAAAFALVCNAIGLDCVEITSETHAWNRVRIDGVWYNVDPTWDDQYMDDSSGQYSAGYYSYFNISTSKITGSLDQNNAHVQESIYASYMPSSICDKDSTASGSSFGSLADATGALNVSDAGFTLSEASGKYTLNATSLGSNITYYYYVNGTASPVQNKSIIYSSAVSLGSSVNYVTVVAVRPDYTDSIMTLTASSTTASSTPSGSSETASGSGDTTSGSESTAGNTGTADSDAQNATEAGDNAVSENGGESIVEDVSVDEDGSSENVDTSADDNTSESGGSSAEADTTGSTAEGTGQGEDTAIAEDETAQESADDGTSTVTVTDCEHENASETVVSPATTGENGMVSFTCEDCKETWTEDISRIESITLAYKKRIYTGDELKPKVTVTDADGNEVSSDYYTVEYFDNMNVGVASARVTFSGRYSGTVTRKFTIRPAGTTLTDKQYFTYNSKKVRIYIKPQTTQITGYEIQYSTKRSLAASKSLSVTVKKSKKSVVLKRLKKSTRYYLRVRTYKVVRIDGEKKTIYSKWSNKYTFTTRG